jgi:hypothetical protein
MDRDLGTGELNSLFVKFYSIPMIKMSSIENVAGDGKIKITFEFALALPEKFSLDVAMSIDDMKGISFVEKAITLTTIKEKINNDCYNYILTRIEDDYALKQLAIIVCSTNEKYKPYLETVKTAQLESLIKIPEIYTEMRTEIKQTLESYYQASDNSKMVELFTSFEPALANEIPFNRMYDEKVAIPGILKFEEEYLVKYQTDLGLTNDDITAIRTQEKQFFIDSTALTTSELEVIVPFLNQDRLLKTLTIESKFPSENDNSLLLAAESANANLAYNDNWIVVRRMMFDNVERDNIEKIYLTDMYLVNLLNSDKITNGLAKIDIIRQNGSKIDDYSIEFDGEMYQKENKDNQLEKAKEIIKNM